MQFYPGAEVMERSGPGKGHPQDLLSVGPTLEFWLEQRVKMPLIEMVGGNCGAGE